MLKQFCLQLDRRKYFNQEKLNFFTSADIAESLDGGRVFVWSVCGQQAFECMCINKWILVSQRAVYSPGMT